MVKVKRTLPPNQLMEKVKKCKKFNLNIDI